MRPLPRTWCAPCSPADAWPASDASCLRLPPLPAPAAAAAAPGPALVCLLSVLQCLVPLLRPRLLMPRVTEQEELDAASRAVDDAAANPVRARARRVRMGRAQRAQLLAGYWQRISARRCARLLQLSHRATSICARSRAERKRACMFDSFGNRCPKRRRQRRSWINALHSKPDCRCATHTATQNRTSSRTCAPST